MESLTDRVFGTETIDGLLIYLVGTPAEWISVYGLVPWSNGRGAGGESATFLGRLPDGCEVELAGIRGRLQVSEVAAHWSERPRSRLRGTVGVPAEEWAEWLSQFVR